MSDESPDGWVESHGSSFKWVEIEGFRGFRDRQRIELDASAVLITGPNGTGKTSFFDALQWLLLGSLQRLEKWRVRKNDEHIVNCYRGAQPAIVEAEVELRGARVRLSRQGRYDAGLLELHSEQGSLHGEEADRELQRLLTARPGQDVRRLLLTSALLQQDVVREVLEDKPAERYKQLAGMLGLDELGLFEAAVRSRSERLSTTGAAVRAELEQFEERVTASQARLASAEGDVRLAEDVAAARVKIVERLKDLEETVRVRVVPSTSAGAALLQRAAVGAERELADLRRGLDDILERRSRLAAPSTDIEEYERRISDLQTKLATASAVAEPAEARLLEATARSSSLTSLAIQAIELLGPQCPVCGQDINEGHVRQHLLERIKQASNAELAAILEETNEARALLADVHDELAREQAALGPLVAARHEWQELEQERERWNERCAAFGEGDDSPLEFRRLADLRAGHDQALVATLAGLRSCIAAAADLVAVLRTDQSDIHLSELRAELRRLQDTVEALRERTRLASKQEEDGKRIQRAATRAVAAVTERRFKRLAPTVQNIYQRLDPHPSFTTLDFALDVYNRRGIASPVVRDLVENVDADPLLVFSSSQANVTALSYFLALGWAAGPDALPFVLLDDPLQSMDDVNALGFADLCRHVRTQRQMVVSTHERRLASLLQRKLAPRTSIERTRVVEFQAWTRAGPVLKQSVVEPQLDEGRQRSVIGLSSA